MWDLLAMYYTESNEFICIMLEDGYKESGTDFAQILCTRWPTSEHAITLMQSYCIIYYNLHKEFSTKIWV